MVRLAPLLITLPLLALLPQIALADGGIFIPDYTHDVYAPSQKAVVIWHRVYDATMETIILSTRITMDQPDNVAWVVPVPSATKPEVTAGNISIFYDIAEFLSPARRRGGLYQGFGATEGANAPGVEVVEEKKVDIYDIAILKATDAGVLAGWLNDNGFSMPDGAEDVLQYYVSQGDFYFIANKIDMANVYGNMTFTQNDTDCASAFYRLYDENYYNTPYYDENYVSEVLAGRMYMSDDINASCAGASADSVVALFNLRMGISTPLKIKFMPPHPFYPMKMTSLNQGWVDVDVYVFADYYLNDASGMMYVSKNTKASNSLKAELGLDTEDSLTMLTFRGNASELDRDSVLVQGQYDPEMDPYYAGGLEPAVDAMAYLVMMLLSVPLLLLFLWPVTILPIFAGGIVGWLMRGKKCKAAWKRAAALVVLIAAETMLSVLVFGPSALFGIESAALLVLLAAVMTATSFVSTNLKWKPWKRIAAVVLSTVIAFIIFIVIMLLTPVVY